MARRFQRLLAAAAIAALAASCGGGGGAGEAGGGGGSPPPPPQPPPGSAPDLGPGADLHGWIPFPADNPWNTPVDQDPVDPQSDAIVAEIGASEHLHPDFGADWDGGPFGIPYVVVAGTQAKVPVTFGYADESDPGPYPIPPDAPIEGGASSTGDRHVLVVDRDAWTLHETWSSYPWPSRDGWDAGSGAFFDLSSDALRPDSWTSADAAGLPVFPGLVRYDEVVGRGEIRHALRFTVARTRRAFVHPATHFASSDPSASLPPMGARFRLKASVPIDSFPPQSRVVLTALRRYGMFVADNGSDWFLSGAPDARWDDSDLNSLKSVPGSAFELVLLGPLVTN